MSISNQHILQFAEKIRNNIINILRSMKTSIFLTLWLAISIHAFSQVVDVDSSQWQLTRSDQGIKVYVRDITGTPRKEFKAVMVLPYAWQDIYYIVGDFPNYHKWISSYERSEILQSTPDGIVYEHHYTKTPFLTKPRDVIHRIEQRKLDNGFVRTFTAAPDFIPELVDTIRLRIFDGYWAGQGLGKNQTIVTHVVTLAPGGNIGEYLSNSNVSVNSFNTMVQLRTYMEERNSAASNQKK